MQDLNKFAVVEFSDYSVAAVPIKWLINSRTQCFWPPSNTSKLCKEDADAQVTSWKLFSVNRIFGLYSSYSIARMQAKEAENTSNLESESDLVNLEHKKNTRKERMKKQPAVEPDSDCDENRNKSKHSLVKPPPPINFTTNIIQPPHPTTDGELTVIPNSNFAQGPLPAIEALPEIQTYHTLSPADEVTINDDSDNTPTSCSEDNSQSTPDAHEPAQIMITPLALESMYRTLKTLELKVEENKLLLEELLRRSDRQGAITAAVQKFTKPSGCPAKFPLEDHVTFTEWETFLGNEKQFDYAVSYFSFVSKCGPAENVRHFLAKLLSNELADKFNWAGHGEKQSFKTTLTKKLLYAYPRTPSNSQEEKSMDDAVKNWLKSAKARSHYKRAPK